MRATTVENSHVPRRVGLWRSAHWTPGTEASLVGVAEAETGYTLRPHGEVHAIGVYCTSRGHSTAGTQKCSNDRGSDSRGYPHVPAEARNRDFERFAVHGQTRMEAITTDDLRVGVARTWSSGSNADFRGSERSTRKRWVGRGDRR